MTFTERMIGAATLDVRVYEEVEADTTATTQAMGVVLLSSLASGVGAVGLGNIGLGGVVGGSIAALIGWGIWALLTYLIGTRLLAEPQTEADIGQLLRTLGFAQAPGLVRILGGVPGVGPLVLIVVWVWMLVAMVIAGLHQYCSGRWCVFSGVGVFGGDQFNCLHIRFRC